MLQILKSGRTLNLLLQILYSGLLVFLFKFFNIILQNRTTRTRVTATPARFLHNSQPETRLCTNFVEPVPYQHPIPHQTFADTVNLAQVRNVRQRPVEPNIENVAPIRNVRQRPSISLHAAFPQPQLTPIQRIRIRAQQIENSKRDRLRAIRAPPINLSLNEKFYYVCTLFMCF